MDQTGSRPWRIAMSEALYGEGGFYVTRGGPGRHFRTSAHVGSAWVTAIHTLAGRVDDALGRPDPFTIVDVGAGGGELLDALSSLSPPRWSLVGTDMAKRPAGLSPAVVWNRDRPSQIRGLIVANELLDVVELDVIELTDAGPRLVTVSPTGVEGYSDRIGPDHAEWQQRWWPLAQVGDRAEIGCTRDSQWRAITASLDRGVAVAIDYAAVPSRDVGGTLTGYRDGRQVMPIPDGSCDLTAHVLFESLTAAGDVVLSQREALRLLGISAKPPAYDANPLDYLAGLGAAGRAAELLDREALGGFTWLVHHKGVASPLVAP